MDLEDLGVLGVVVSQFLEHFTQEVAAVEEHLLGELVGQVLEEMVDLGLVMDLTHHQIQEVAVAGQVIKTFQRILGELVAQES